jgi:non-specific serine/threonine protein kinase/serine/threonine-protein kinase
MTPERWQEVKSVWHEAVALDAGGRAALLARIGATDDTLRAEVESLLAADDGAEDAFLNVPPHAALGLASLQASMVGRRCGPFELIEELGVGGMGEVYKARRVDDEYRHDVAIKLVHALPGASFIGNRLRAERQILASLQHPNIARLLDGGTTAEGVPYLVMELIDGKPITDYCDEHKLDVRARLNLFLQVCAAVQYAHQRMVIHRDLKPSNILVTREGVPKLLDFGISKILHPRAVPERTDVTIATLGILTPQYASPEQLLGEPVTTASDVYSLGVLLYEVLTGTRPYALPDDTSREMRVSAIRSEPRRPSTVAANRQLRGDLDRIVLMALRREPDRRYGTAEQLAEDIRRYLDHRPVMARPPTPAYLISSFVTRHRAAVAVSAFIVVGLVAGMVLFSRQARIAEGHRAQAEARFNDIRKLTNSLIFDIDSSIRDLPGGAATRKVLINTSLEYLATLAKDAAGDPDLQIDTAAAYQRLGDIQGSFQASQDDYSGALQSYQRALSLLEQAAASPQSRERATEEIQALYNRLSDVLWTVGEVDASLSYAERALLQARAGLTSGSSEAQDQFSAAIYRVDYGYKIFRMTPDHARGARYMREALDGLAAVAHARAPPHIRRGLGVSYYKYAELLLESGDFAAALDFSLKSMRIFAALQAGAPADPDFRVNEAAAKHYAAAALMNLNRLTEARRYEDAAFATMKSLRELDPGIAEFQGFVSMALTALAEISERQRQPAAAIPLLEEAIQASDAALKGGTKHPYIRHSRGKTEAQLGRAFEMLSVSEARGEAQRAQDRETARAWYERALQTFEDVRPIWFGAGNDAKRMKEAIARTS